MHFAPPPEVDDVWGSPTFPDRCGSLVPQIFHFNSNLTCQHLERRLGKNLGMCMRPCACEFYVVTLAWASLQFILGNSASMNMVCGISAHMLPWMSPCLAYLSRKSSLSLHSRLCDCSCNICSSLVQASVWFCSSPCYSSFLLFPAMYVVDTGGPRFWSLSTLWPHLFLCTNYLVTISNKG